MAIENEAKFELSSATYEAILGASRFLHGRLQCNQYFDDDWKLADRGATFRFRIERETLCMLKIPAPTTFDGVRSSLETARPLTEAFVGPLPRSRAFDVSALIEDYRVPLLALKVHRLSRLGEMWNDRVTVHLEGLGELELDRASLPDGSLLFELEIERPNAEDIGPVVAELRARWPDLKASELSKFQRFRRALQAAATR